MKTKKAFTIVETLITLLAITIMIVAPLTFMFRSYRYAEFAKIRMVATGLAQEGIELATSLRNKNLSTFQSVANRCITGCTVDWDGVSDTPVFDRMCNDNDISNEQNCMLYKNSSDANQIFRTFGSGNDQETDFYRYVKFTPSGTDSYIVESVGWGYADSIKVKASLKKLIFNIDIK